MVMMMMIWWSLGMLNTPGHMSAKPPGKGRGQHRRQRCLTKMSANVFCQAVWPTCFPSISRPFTVALHMWGGEGCAANCPTASTSPQAFQHEPTPENGFFNKDFRPSTQPCPEQIPTVAQTQHSTQPQHRHMPEAIQMQPRHIRTNASQISWKHKWDAQKRCAPQPHIQPWQSFSHAFWYLTFFYLTFITDILYHVLSDELIFWHIAWRFYLTYYHSDVLSGI